MKIKELRKLTKEKLIDRLQKAREEIIDVAFDIKTGEEKDYSVAKSKRKEVARILTLIKEDKAPKTEGKKETTVKKTKEETKMKKATKKDDIVENKKESKKK